MELQSQIYAKDNRTKVKISLIMELSGKCFMVLNDAANVVHQVKINDAEWTL